MLGGEEEGPEVAVQLRADGWSHLPANNQWEQGETGFEQRTGGGSACGECCTHSYFAVETPTTSVAGQAERGKRKVDK